MAIKQRVIRDGGKKAGASFGADSRVPNGRVPNSESYQCTATIMSSDISLPALFIRVLNAASKAHNLPTIHDETQVSLLSPSIIKFIV
jgi:hypothetical protein